MMATISQYQLFFIEQVMKPWRTVLAVFMVALAVVGSLYFLGISAGIPLSSLASDPATVTKTPVYIGILSNLGVLVWASAAACALLGAALMRSDPRKMRFLLVSGLFTSLLALDDLLLFHEHVLPRFFHIPEKVTYLAYLLLAVVYLLYFRKDIVSTSNYQFLALALFFLGLSVVTGRIFLYQDLVEFGRDSLKFIGIVYWLAYFSHTVIRFVGEASQIGFRNNNP